MYCKSFVRFPVVYHRQKGGTGCLTSGASESELIANHDLLPPIPTWRSFQQGSPGNAPKEIDMNRMPPEILCNIFLAALPHPIDRREYLSSVVAPLHLSHVCRTWRALSLSFGKLWSYLCIEYDPSRPYITGKGRMSLKATVSVFDTWIERSNGVPLNFRVECRCYSFHATAGHRLVEHIITSMISQQHRWRDVVFTWWDLQISLECPGLNLTNMPMLTSLALDVRLPLRSKISIAQSPRLRRLYIRAPDFDLMTGDEPLCSLTESAEITFCYEKLSSRRALHLWLDVLKAAPFLTEFIADSHVYKDPPWPRAQNEPLIRLPNLRVLKLECDDESEAASFLVDYLTLPNLQVLVFTRKRRDEDVKAEMLTSFIRRSLPPLGALEMKWDGVHEEVIIPILHLLPTLTYLRLDGASVTRHFFHELTVPSRTGVDSLLGVEHATVCPALETLYLQKVEFEVGADLWVALISMLKSRPRGLGKSNVIYLKDGNKVPTRVELSALEEDIGDSRREARRHVRWKGMVIGDYEATKSLLMRGY